MYYYRFRYDHSHVTWQCMKLQSGIMIMHSEYFYLSRDLCDVRETVYTQKLMLVKSHLNY